VISVAYASRVTDRAKHCAALGVNAIVNHIVHCTPRMHGVRGPLEAVVPFASCQVLQTIGAFWVFLIGNLKPTDARSNTMHPFTVWYALVYSQRPEHCRFYCRFDKSLRYLRPLTIAYIGLWYRHRVVNTKLAKLLFQIHFV
jgi:hypothetical protein